MTGKAVDSVAEAASKKRPSAKVLTKRMIKLDLSHMTIHNHVRLTDQSVERRTGPQV